MWWRRALAFYATLPAGATAYFFVFWHWFDYWRARPKRTYLLIGITFSVLGAALFAARDQLLPEQDGPHWSLQALGWIVIVVASVFGTVADRQIGFRIRSFTPFFEHHAHLTLRTSGAYGVVRHPIYAAGGAFQLGTFLVTGYPVVLASFAIFIGGAVWFTAQEELRLRALLDDPAEYDRYRERVPALVPRLRSRL